MSAYDWDLQAHHQQQQFAAVEPPSNGKGGKRSRQTYSKYQTVVLETVFQTSKYIVRSKRQQMSAELNLTERQIKIWFQNRRMKEKKCHKEVLRIEHHRPATTGYTADDFIIEPAAGYLAVPTNDSQNETYVDGYHRSESKHIEDGGYAGYVAGGGYDLQTPERDNYVAKQQWSPVDFHQDFYGDHALDHFQRMPPITHHHHPMNSQVPDYCPPQLQATHGY